MSSKTLTRNEFYKLSHECRDYALHLATHDQDLVDRGLCEEFNQFLGRVREYDLLRQPLANLRSARPITRGMVMGGVLAIWLILGIAGGRWVLQLGTFTFLSVGLFLLLGVFVIPPRVYGTSVETIEGRVLVVTQALQAILETGELDFSEAAYFTVRDVLREAASELRQQVYLNRVAGWR